MMHETVYGTKITYPDPEIVSWGMHFFFGPDDELLALKVAYLYRNCPYGVKVESLHSNRGFMVTVFNEMAAKTGIDRS